MRTAYAIPLGLAIALLPVACSLEDNADDDSNDNSGGASAGKAGGGGSSAGTSGSSGKGGSGGSSLAGSAGSSAGTSQGGTGTSGTGGKGGAGGSTAGTVGTSGAAGSAAGSSGAGGSMAGSGGSTGGSAGSGGGKGGAGGSTGGSAGGDGGKAGSGGSSSTGFDPCPADGPCVVLPLGDSITDGLGYSGGYRVELFHLALEDGKSITFVGNSMNGPQTVDGMPFPRAHEGHSGWTIQQIDGITPSPALEDEPDIVLLHIGTNDMYQTPAGAPDRLGALMDQIITALPDSLLVVSNIIPFPQGSSATSTYNAAVPGVVNARIDAGKHVVYVDQFMGFPTSELGDGVHPNQAGYERMAGKWYAAISSYLH